MSGSSTVRAFGLAVGAPILVALTLLAVGCGSGGTSVAMATGHAGASLRASERHALATRYLAIAVPSNARLDTGFDRLSGRDKPDLAASRDDLRSIAATERQFDQQLLGIAFPSATADIAWELVQVNEARAALTTTAIGATSLSQLRAYEQRLDRANVPVEQWVTDLRAQLGLPPPETS